MTDQLTNGLEAVEQRRQRLRQLMDRLEAALARPAGADPDGWRSQLAGLTAELDHELRSHVEDTEGPGGLFDDVMTTAPRLARHVDQVRDEHPGLLERVRRLGAAVDERRDVDVVREEGLDLLTALIVHRQHGADLLYEAYWIDVGGLSD